jgi:hypothetical protein
VNTLLRLLPGASGMMKTHFTATAAITTVTASQQVTRTGPVGALSYTWSVTFVSNPGAFPPAAGSVPALSQISTGLTQTLPAAAAASVSVASVVPGAAGLGGTFQLQFGGITTLAIANNAKPSAVQAALVAAGVAGVEVTAGATGGTTAHSWRVTFAHCSTGAIAGSDLCNDGNVANLVVLSGGLTGCSPRTPAVIEVVPGSAGTVQLVTDLTGGAPYSADLTGLAPGVPVYVRVSAHTQKSFGYRALPSPLMATPSSVKPGQMEPVRLKSSTASTISKYTHSQ